MATTPIAADTSVRAVAGSCLRTRHTGRVQGPAAQPFGRDQFAKVAWQASLAARESLCDPVQLVNEIHGIDLREAVLGIPLEPVNVGITELTP